jgi:rod shape-determining protein MreD
MISDILKQSLLFALFLFLQVLVVNNIHFQVAWFINPFIYIGFVLLLPIDTPKWLLLVTAFLMGYFVDVFLSTPGMHASATVLTAFVRHYLHKVVIPRDDFQPATIPNVVTFGFPWFIRYAMVMVGVHHFSLFMVEAFSFAQFHIVLLKTIASGIVTLMLIIVGQLFTIGTTKNR